MDELSFPEPILRSDRARCVTGYVSAKALESTKGIAKVHLDLRCSGMERSVAHPEEDCTFRLVEFNTLRDLARWADARPCRVCALEAVLDVVLRPGRATKLVAATFTSQPNPLENLAGYKWSSATTSGSERLLRIAERLDLETTVTGCGPVAWGLFPSAGVKVLARNLRTQVIPDLGERPLTAVELQIYWSLLSDDPPELAVDPRVTDPWEIARLVGAH